MKKLQKKAIERLKHIEEYRNSPVFKKVMGKFIQAGLLENLAYKPYKGRVTINDAVIAGQYEPRILELIPAILIKKPNLFDIKGIRPELKKLVMEIKKGIAEEYFMGIAPEKYLYWVDKIGHKGKKTNLLKTYRFVSDDIFVINELKKKISVPEIQIIRMALLEFYQKRL